MNKYKEALDKLCELGRKELTFREICEMEIAVEYLQRLVEKATPKKAIAVKGWADLFICPSCYENFFKGNLYPTKYCSYCGQTLDWSEEDVD